MFVYVWDFGVPVLVTRSFRARILKRYLTLALRVVFNCFIYLALVSFIKILE
jgi:hypothetical protein